MGIRAIEQRHQGNRHGIIRRLISPEDLGQRLKPFIFLDYINTNAQERFGFGFHPHSGIATLTYQQGADVEYEDTAGQKGVVEAGGLEWMQAGGGVWHQGYIQPKGTITGFQLWIALPPGIEDGVSQGLYIPPDAVPIVDNVKVLLGEYGQKNSPIAAPSPMHYFDLKLAKNEHWLYHPPTNHGVAWCFVYQGAVLVSDETVSNELVIFDEAHGAIEMNALSDAKVLIGTAVKHAYPLVLGSSSVHTNATSLKQGLRRIEEIGQTLRAQGRI